MFQKTIIVGNLGGDPVMRYTPQAKAVTSFSVAVNEGKDKTVWFRVSAWGKEAENCNQYLKKGQQVAIEGRLVADESGNPRTYQRKDGTSSASFELTADRVRFGKSAEYEQQEVAF